MSGYTPFTISSLDGSVCAHTPVAPSRIDVSLDDPPAELARRLAEDVSGWGWPMARQWSLDGPGAGFAGAGSWAGASGTINDRRGGRNLPLIWNEIDLRGFRVLSRFLAETNPFAIGFGLLLKNFHIRKGYGWQACLKGVKKTAYQTVGQPTDPLVAKAQAILDQFRDEAQWPIQSREAFNRWRRDGEVFGRLGYGGWGRLPWFRFVEPEQVGSPTGDSEGPGSFGVETERGDAAKKLAYHVWDMEGDGLEGDWIDAVKIVHLTANTDSCVKRGVPDYVPVHELLDGARKLLRNMLTTAIDQAAVTWIEKFPTATVEQVRGLIPQQTTAPGQTMSALAGNPPWAWAGNPWGVAGPHPGGNRFRPSTVIRTEGNRQYEPGPTSSGVPSYVQVEQAALRGCCVRWNLPEYASGDASNNNFASSLVSGSPFTVTVEGSQFEWGSGFERPVALKVLDLACDAGLLTRAERARLDVETTEPAVVTPKPQEDTERRGQMNQAGVLSVTTWQQQEGLDPQHEAANFAAESKRKSAQEQPPAGGVGAPAPPGGGVAAVLGESRAVESAPPGPPPHPGLVWKPETSRWVHPGTGEEHEHTDDVVTLYRKAYSHFDSLTPAEKKNLSLYVPELKTDTLRTFAQKQGIKAPNRQSLVAATLSRLAGTEAESPPVAKPAPKPAAVKPAKQPKAAASSPPASTSPGIAGVMGEWENAAGKAKSYLAAALGNLGALDMSDKPTNAGEHSTDEKEIARRVASVWAQAHEDGLTPEEIEPITRALTHAGVTTRHEPGERVRIDGRYHEVPRGKFTGDAAVVKQPALIHELPDGREVVLAKAVTEDKSGLVPKQITDKNGVRRTVMVRPGETHPDEASAASPPPELSTEGLAEHLEKAEPGLSKRPGVLGRIAEAVVKATDWVNTRYAANFETIQQVGSLLAEVVDLPSDMKKFGYNPSTTGTTHTSTTGHDPIKAAGMPVSGHVVAGLAARVLVKAIAWAGKKIAGKSESADAVSLLVEVLYATMTHIAESLGVTPPDLATVESLVQLLAKAKG